MPDSKGCPRFLRHNVSADNASSASQSLEQEALRPLVRLHQLALEIQAALARDNLDLVYRATALLAPTLAQWQATADRNIIDAAQVTQMIQETRALLDACEVRLTQRMSRIGQKLRRLHQGRRAIALVRTRNLPAITSRLDMRR